MATHIGERQVQTAWSGSILDFFGNKIHIKLTAEDTGGAYALVEYDAAPHFEGQPPHIHEQTAEYVYVLDGEISILFGSRRFTMKPGDGMLVPPGALHTFSNPHGERARFVTMLSPGGFEGFLAEAAELAEIHQWPPAPTRLAELLARYDIIVPRE